MFSMIVKAKLEYFSQVKGQLAITGLLWCDLRVERISFGESLVSKMKSNLDLFHFDRYIHGNIPPEIQRNISIYDSRVTKS